MAILKGELRDLFESRCGGRPDVFESELGHLIGLNDAKGNAYYDDAGNRTLKNPTNKSGAEFARIPINDFSLKCLFESVMGVDASMQNISAALSPEALQGAAITKAMGKQLRSQGRRELLEDNGAGAVMGSAFANINAFTGAIGGLLEIGILEQWQMPEFIGDDLAPPAPSRMFEGKKFIGVTRIGDQADERLPGEPTKRVQVGQRWVTQPRTVENALACEVTQEAVFLDLTPGEVMEQTGDVGGWLRWRKEIRIINAFVGVTNTYTYNDANFSTWQSNGTWNNDLPGNDLQFPENVITAEVAFRDMIDPATGVRVRIIPNTILCQRERQYIADALVGGDDYEYRSAPGSASNGQQFRKGKNPLKTRGYRVLESALVYQVLTDPVNGLGLSASAAQSYWWLFESGKFMVYAQNWPLRTQQAVPTSSDMIDRGMVLYVKADERGIPMIMEPRRGTRNHS